MKRGWKLFWILSGVLFCVGGVLCITGLILGASPRDIGNAMSGVYFNEDGLTVGDWHVPFTDGRAEDAEESEEMESEEGNQEIFRCNRIY